MQDDFQSSNRMKEKPVVSFCSWKEPEKPGRLLQTRKMHNKIDEFEETSMYGSYFGNKEGLRF